MQQLGLAGHISPGAFGALLDACLGSAPAVAAAAPAVAPPALAPLAPPALAPPAPPALAPPSKPPSVPAKAPACSSSSAAQAQPDPLSYFYPRLELNVTEPVLVTHISDPFRVYCQLRSFSKEIQRLPEVMDQSFEAFRGRDLQEPLPAMPGSPCAARLVDGCWYRTLLLEVYSRGGPEEQPGAVALVISVDYGKKEFVTRKNLRRLPAECFRMPVVTYPCSLKGLTDGGIGWAHSQIIQLKTMLLGKVMHAHIETYCPFEHLYYVTLYGENGLNFNSLYGLQAHCLTQSLLYDGPSDFIGELKSVDAPDMEEPGSLQGVLSRLAAAPLPNTLSSVGQNHFWTKMEFYCVEQVEVGNSVDVVVSYTENPSLFWCQLAKHSGDLRALMAKIQNDCVHSLQPYDWSSPVCLAKYPGDNKWYRALIISKESCTESAEVEYVDYGNKECVSLKDIRATKAEFLQLKAQAFRCSLYNLIQPKGQDPFIWDEKATEAFQEFVDSASRMELKCTVFASAALNNTEIFNIVDLVTPFESVCQFLTSRNLARPVQPEKSLIPSVHLLSYYYSAHNLKIGSEEVVYVTHVNSPSFFYCQLASSTDALNQLSSSIGKLNRMWQKSQASQAPGNVYLAKYNDGSWYRAIVTSAEATKEVFFVDFGNTELLKNEDLIVVPSDAYELLRLPRLAIKCCLSDVVDLPKDATVWFKKTVLDKPLKAIIVAKESDGTLIIELYDGNMQINEKLKQVFRLEGSSVVSKSVDNDVSLYRYPVRRKSNTEVMPAFMDTVKPFPDSKKSCIENLETVGSNKPRFSWGQGRVEPEKTKREVTGKSSRWIDRHESVDDRKGRGFQKTPFQKRERETDDESHRQSKANTYFVPKNISDLPQKNIKPGLKTLVYVSHINDPSDFYIQLVEDELLLDLILEKLSSSKMFESQKQQKLHTGDLISAVFADDGLWYRAVVNEEPSDELVSVQYIDYGNTGVIDICKTGQLLEECSSFPVMSIHCTLYDVKTVGFLEWTEERVQYFSQRTNEVQLIGQFVGIIEGKWEILLCDKKGNVTVDLVNSNPKDPKTLVVDTGSKTQNETVRINLLEVDLGKNRNSTSNSVATSFHWKIPKVGQTVNIFLVAAKSPGYFWCQLTDTDTLDSIERKLREVEEPEGIVADDIVNGCPCLAKQSKDGTFYRAVVINIEQSILTVIHIDYGTEALTGIEMVWKIPDELLAIPPQAFLCCPFGFNVEEGSWTEGINKAFCDVMGGHPVDVTIVDKNHGPFAVPMFVADLQPLKVNVNEQMKCHSKCSTENSGSTMPPICSPEEENNDGQGKNLEAVVFETGTNSLVSTENIDASDLLTCSNPLLSGNCCPFDAGEAFSAGLPTYQTRHRTTVETVNTEDPCSVIESLDGEVDCYVPEEKRERSHSVDSAEMQHPASSKTEVSKQDPLEAQAEAESPAEKLMQGVFDTPSMSDLGLVLSDDTKQVMKESEMLGVPSSKDTLELETDEKPLLGSEVQKRLELMLYEGLRVQKELQESPSLTDKTDDLSVEFVTHEEHPWQVDESEVPKPLLDLSAAFTLANTEGHPPFSETELQNFSCTEVPVKVCEGEENVSKMDCTEWQSLLENGSRETQMSCDVHEMHNEIGFVGEDCLSNTQLDKGVEDSGHIDTKGMTFNLTGFEIGSICMVRSGDQWHKAQILGTSAEGTKVLNLVSGNEEFFHPTDVWNGMPEVESTLTEALNNKTNTLDSLLRSGLEAEEKEITGGSDCPCGNVDESISE
ncbi:hypothetical protein JRQ81_001901 [Phrynocephalus forsythii]|uniref:Tudor domain-containing protein n=1 Tax=Phrynocephalus forsythii TaxID=171643 RepID=A0A9Q0Y9V4_9SAUR|nr:hypothetical protein JRQ81_001901 [Phrynocephalus forsythii]